MSKYLIRKREGSDDDAEPSKKGAKVGTKKGWEYGVNFEPGTYRWPTDKEIHEKEFEGTLIIWTDEGEGEERPYYIGADFEMYAPQPASDSPSPAGGAGAAPAEPRLDLAAPVELAPAEPRLELAPAEPRLELAPAEPRFDLTTPLELARKLDRSGGLDRTLQASMARRHSEKDTVSSWRSIEVSLKTFKLLKKDWLNMDLITFFLEWWRDRTGGGGGTEKASCAPDARPRCWYANTYFFTRLTEDGDDAVRKWVPDHVFQEYDKLIIPVNDNNVHWYLAVVNFRDKRVEVFDSIRDRQREKTRGTLLGWLERTYPARFSKAFPTFEWSELKSPPESVPQQDNGSDCGVFTCLFAAYCSLDREHHFDFSQADIGLLRHYMANVICGADRRPA